MQPVVPPQVAVVVACTFRAPTASLWLVACTGQPASVPLLQLTARVAEVAANCLFWSTPAAVAAVLVVALICAWHALVPSHPVAPSPVLVLCRPAGPAIAVEVAVSFAVQPASGQLAIESVWPLPEVPGSGVLALSPLLWPESTP